VSDHPEVPRVEFNFDGESMNVEEAVNRFRRLLTEGAKVVESRGEEVISLQVNMRACDCDYSLDGRDKECALHGDKT